MSEERNPDQNEEEDIIMDEIRGEHWRDFSEEGVNNKKIFALGWDVYVKEKEKILNRDFWCPFHI